MDSEFKSVVAICVTVVLVFALGVSGCTYTTSRMNQQYYSSMDACMARGASWIPSRGNNEAACVVK